MLLESKRELLICRDDLRYTDTVIATLQCTEYEPWLKAALLNIPDDDVAYHIAEIDGLSTNGAQPLTLLDLRNYQRLQARAIVAEQAAEAERERKAFKPLAYSPTLPSKPAKPAKQAPKPKAPQPRHDYKLPNPLYNTMRKWSDDPEYYRARTAAEIATEMGCSREFVYRYCKINYYTFKKMIRTGNTTKKRGNVDNPNFYPTDPEWYRERTIQQAADELGISYQSMSKHKTRKMYIMATITLADINNEYFPYPVEWYADKTVKEIAQVLRYSQDKVRHWLKTREIKFVYRYPSRKIKG
jgi:AraC-like DNA-binding protein